MPKKAKKVKDLKPKKAGAKKVKGGRRSPGSHAGAVLDHTGRAVDNVGEGVGDTINNTGQAFNRALNPR